MNSSKYAGITLLFKKDNFKTVDVYLKSYVISIENFKSNLKKIVSNELSYNSIEFVGIEDLFFVSGKFKEFSVLGKTTFNEFNTFKKAKNLIRNQKSYTIKEENINTKFLLLNLVYFYSDKLKNTNFTITCLVPIKSVKFINSREMVLDKIQSNGFKRKIVTEKISRINNIEFVGIENLSSVNWNSELSTFQTFFKRFKKNYNVTCLLGDKKEISKKKKQILKKSK
jgi:hypothetical protein